MIDLASWQLDTLRATWQAARPFGHVVVDALVTPDALAGLIEAAGREQHWPETSEIFQFFGSSVPPTQPALCAFGEALGSPEMLFALQTITGESVARVDVRSYFYGPGNYLLPHLDHSIGYGRRLAYAYYLAVPPSAEAGGELELFDVDLDGTQVVATRSALRIAPRANRIVIFEVSDRSLHQVREVLDGGRLSLAGWFY